MTFKRYCKEKNEGFLSTYKRALLVMDFHHCPLSYADSHLFDWICDTLTEWAEDEEIELPCDTLEMDESDILAYLG